MRIEIFSPITVRTESYLQTIEEEKTHKKQESEALEAIKSKILSKDIIGILEVRRYLEIESKTTDWVTLIITPDADELDGPLHRRMIELLSENGYGLGGVYLAGLHITVTGGPVSKLRNILEELV